MIKLRRKCVMDGVIKSIDHVCAGKVKKVPVPIGFFARARKPYCEFHAAWVKGNR